MIVRKPAYCLPLDQTVTLLAMANSSSPSVPRHAAGAAGIIGAFVASLCCAGPLLVASLGLLSIPTAGALSDRLFYGYWWAFVSGGLLVTGIALAAHFRSRGVCTLDAARRRRREITSAALAALLVFVVSYLIWDYVIVEAIGIHMHLWRSPLR